MRAFVTLIAFAAALGAAGSAHAEKWKMLRTGSGAVAFDEDSLRASITTGVATLDTVLYMAQPQLFDGGTYHYVAERLAFDCRRGLYRRTNQAVISPAGEALAVRDDTDWRPVDPGASSAFQRIACTTERPPGTTEIARMMDLLPAMARPAAAPAAAPAAPPAAAAPAAPELAPAPAAPPVIRLRPAQ